MSQKIVQWAFTCYSATWWMVGPICSQKVHVWRKSMLDSRTVQMCFTNHITCVLYASQNNQTFLPTSWWDNALSTDLLILHHFLSGLLTMRANGIHLFHLVFLPRTTISLQVWMVWDNEVSYLSLFIVTPQGYLTTNNMSWDNKVHYLLHLSVIPQGFLTSNKMP